MVTAELESKVCELETSLAVQEANLAGAQASQAVAHSGTWSVMATGGAALVIGIFLGMAIAES